MKHFTIGIVFLTVVSAPSWAQQQGGGGVTPPPKPNILVIVLDDVGVETLACYNPPVPTPPTPKISELAQSGVKFTHVYSNPICSPTRATMLTGRYAFRTGMGTLSSFLGDNNLNDYSLPDSEVTIPEALPPAYTSAAFGKWHVSKSTAEDFPIGAGQLIHPIRQGFDYFAGTTENVGNHFNWNLIVGDASGSTLTPVTGTPSTTTFNASRISDEASAWIASVSEPFFAYVCFHPPHKPWQVPPHSLLSSPPDPGIHPAGMNLTTSPDKRLAYDWCLEAVDQEIENLLGSIPAGKYSRTTVIVIADNGTPHEVIDQSVYDFTHAKGTVYEQAVNVPMIASGYMVDDGGGTCTGLVNTADIWRTVIALASLLPPSGVYDGVSFKSMLANPAAASNREHAFVQMFTPNVTYDPDDYDDHCLDVVTTLSTHQRAITDGRYKYIRRYTQPIQEAYDLWLDPLETNDIWPWPDDECNPHYMPPNGPALWALRNAMVDLSGM